LEETYRGPGCAHRARDKGTVAKNRLGEFVERGQRGSVEGFVGRDREHEKDTCEDAGKGWEGLNPIGEVGAETRWIGRMQSSTCEGCDERMC